MIDGRASSINFAATHVPTIIHAWFPGEFGGQAIAEALFGDLLRLRTPRRDLP